MKGLFTRPSETCEDKRQATCELATRYLPETHRRNVGEH